MRKNYNLKVIEYGGQYHLKKYSKFISKKGAFSVLDSSLKKNPDFVKSREIRTYSEDSLKLAQSHSVNVSRHRTVDSIYKYALCNVWQGFVTLTFDPKLIDSSNYELVSLKMKNWLGNLKKHYSPDLKYLFVPELHSDKVKFHFHGLISDFGKLPLVDSGYMDSSGRSIYNLPLWRYGFSTLTLIENEGSDKVVSYVVKYISKDLCSSLFGKKRYWVSRNINKPIVREYDYAGDFDDLVNTLSSNITRVSSVLVPAAKYEVNYVYVRK